MNSNKSIHVHTAYKMFDSSNIYYFATGRGGEYFDQRVYVCLSLCPLAYRNTTSRNFTKVSVYVLPVAISGSSSDGDAICYVLPVSWMTSCFHIME